jgi:hypothetical protein
MAVETTMSNHSFEQQIDIELDARLLRQRQIDVVEVSEKDTRGVLSLIPRGTITIFVARHGHGLIEDIRTAIKQAAPLPTSWERVIRAGSIGKEGDTSISEVRPVSSMPLERRESAGTRLLVEPVVGEVRYGSKQLVRNLYVPSNGAIVTTCPYNGGRIANDGFALVERCEEGTSAGLDALVVIRAPELTAAERAAVRAVPDAMLEGNIGVGIDANITALVTVVIATELESVAVGAALAFFAMGVWHFVAQGGQDQGNAGVDAGDVDVPGAAGADVNVADVGDAPVGADADFGDDAGADADDQDAIVLDAAGDDADVDDDAETDHHGGIFDDLSTLIHEPHLSAADIATRSPAASAATLLAMRREWLLTRRK